MLLSSKSFSAKAPWMMIIFQCIGSNKNEFSILSSVKYSLLTLSICFALPKQDRLTQRRTHCFSWYLSVITLFVLWLYEPVSSGPASKHFLPSACQEVCSLTLTLIWIHHEAEYYTFFPLFNFTVISTSVIPTTAQQWTSSTLRWIKNTLVVNCSAEKAVTMG